MWPGGTCMGMGSGGPLFDTILTVAGPEKYKKLFWVFLFVFRFTTMNQNATN